jgi:Na+/melibiose symporter-like transporter
MLLYIQEQSSRKLHIERVGKIFIVMKTLILFVAFMLLSTNLWSQNTSIVPYSKEYYLDKSKRQNKTGWFLFGTGIVLSTIGIIGFSNSDFLESNSDTDLYGFLILGGAISGLSSIPVFIGSANNARFAARLTFNSQSNQFQRQNLIVQNCHPVLGIKIEF